MPTYQQGDYVKVEFPDEATGMGNGSGSASNPVTTRKGFLWDGSTTSH